jgi:hypothetical protein
MTSLLLREGITGLLQRLGIRDQNEYEKITQ